VTCRDAKSIVRSTASQPGRRYGLAAASTPAVLPSADPSVSSAALRKALSGRVAFHNADLDREERDAIERRFRDPPSQVTVLVATTTLAMGRPAMVGSVFEGLSHPRECAVLDRRIQDHGGGSVASSRTGGT
jgi:helicase